MTPKQAGLTAIGVGLGVVFAAVLGVVTFLNATTPTLYPTPEEVPAKTHATPSPQWAVAVEQSRQAVRAGIVEKNLPGLSVAVGVGEDLVWAEGFGWADLEKRVPVTPAIRFRIGHVSKAFTSAAVGLLLETGRMHLGDEIQRYVPAFPRKQWPVTLRQLMAHTAGIRHYDREADYTLSGHCEKASEGLELFANDPLQFEPDTRHRYSTYGWILVSAAVEATAGEPFFTFLRNKVFMPLGMTDTTSDSGTGPMPDRATFYYPRFSGDPSSGPELASATDYSCFSGAGGFLSTPSDLVRFGLAMNHSTFLQGGTVRMLQTPQLLASGDVTGSGLGWTLETATLAGKPAPLVSHASLTLLGGSTSFLTFPERDLVVAVTSNISFANTRAIALRIAEAFAGRIDTDD